jgi:glycosyltransferase involved in cell wall biosynthesis
MRIYINTKWRRGPYGGAGNFLQALAARLRTLGVEASNRWPEKYDVALLNALTEDLTLARVKEIAEKGIPIVHRKTLFLSGGGENMRVKRNNVIEGHAQQLDFGPYISHHIFQSKFSVDVFKADGFASDHFNVIHNGADESIWNPFGWNEGIFQRPVERRFWNRSEPFRILISSWSYNPRKGWEIYEQADKADLKNVSVSFIGNAPEGVRFKRIRSHRPLAHRELARFVKQHHALLFCAHHETCSNTIVEAINCGVPVIYLDSGANKELAADYGIEFTGDIESAIERLQQDYERLVEKTFSNPYRMSRTASAYYDIFTRIAGKTAFQRQTVKK